MVYFKTLLGQAALQNRALALTPRQRSAFIQFDGKRNLAEVMKATAGLGVTPADIAHLVELGLLDKVATQASANTPAAPVARMASNVPLINAEVHSPTQTSAILQPGVVLNDQARYSKAYPIATRLTANLGLKGFMLNLAVESAGNLVKLRELAPKIQLAIAPEKFVEFQQALYE